MDEAVDGVVRGFLGAGARFRRLLTARHGSREQVAYDDHVIIRPQDLGLLARAHEEEEEGSEGGMLSFPPRAGRILFEYGFEFDELVEEVRDEEAETHTSADDIGAAFTMQTNHSTGRKIKLTLTFWEEFVLSHGNPDAHAHNMGRIISLVNSICSHASPYFGAMNSELHLDTDGALEAFERGSLESRNDFILVGPDLLPRLNMNALVERGLPFKALDGGGMVIQLRDRFGGHRVF